MYDAPSSATTKGREALGGKAQILIHSESECDLGFGTEPSL
jgi:hypothetical protein